MVTWLQHWWQKIRRTYMNQERSNKAKEKPPLSTLCWFITENLNQHKFNYVVVMREDMEKFKRYEYLPCTANNLLHCTDVFYGFTPFSVHSLPPSLLHLYSQDRYRLWGTAWLLDSLTACRFVNLPATSIPSPPPHQSCGQLYHHRFSVPTKRGQH